MTDDVAEVNGDVDDGPGPRMPPPEKSTSWAPKRMPAVSEVRAAFVERADRIDPGLLSRTTWPMAGTEIVASCSPASPFSVRSLRCGLSTELESPCPVAQPVDRASAGPGGLPHGVHLRDVVRDPQSEDERE
jgi:hypothetical protein